MAKNAPLRSEKRKASTSSSSTRDAKTYSVSSLLGELDDGPDEDIRSYTVEEVRAMREAGLGKTRHDAEEIELDDSFWDNARWQAPLFPPEEPAPKKVSVHLRLDKDVLDWFKAQGKGHLTRMNAVLRAYFESQRHKK
jgi:uncharacterized protein (DUF4415 family)